MTTQEIAHSVECLNLVSFNIYLYDRYITDNAMEIFINSNARNFFCFIAEIMLKCQRLFSVVDVAVASVVDKADDAPSVRDGNIMDNVISQTVQRRIFFQHGAIFWPGLECMDAISKDGERQGCTTNIRADIDNGIPPLACVSE